MPSARILGLLVGFALGVIWAWLGFGAVLLVALLAVIGWIVGGVAASVSAGHLDVATLRDDLLGRSRATT